MSRLFSIVIALISILICAFTGAQTAPSTNLALPEGPLKVKVTGVTGIVQFRSGADAGWAKAAEGTELTEGAELRTGPRSAVRFMIGDDQIVTLDRLGTIQILKANFESGKVFTDLGMKYGRTRYDIDSAAREHDAKVRSPSSVLAVRGTKFISQDQPPFAAQAVSLDGRVMFRDAKKLVSVGSKGGGKAKVDTNSDSPAGTALKNTAAAPNGKFAGQSREDGMRQLETAFGGFTNLGVASLIDQARLQNFTVITVFRDVDLFFGLNWTGLPGSDVDLKVVSPLGETVSKANPNLPSGLATYQDSSPADANGVGGTKAVTWPVQSPSGTYQVTTTKTTKGNVNVTLDAVQGAASTDNPVKLGNDANGQFSYALTDAQPTKTVTVVPQDISLSKAPAAKKVRANSSRKHK